MGGSLRVRGSGVRVRILRPGIRRPGRRRVSGRIGGRILPGISGRRIAAGTGVGRRRSVTWGRRVRRGIRRPSIGGIRSVARLLLVTRAVS